MKFGKQLLKVAQEAESISEAEINPRRLSELRRKNAPKYSPVVYKQFQFWLGFFSVGMVHFLVIQPFYRKFLKTHREIRLRITPLRKSAESTLIVPGSIPGVGKY